MKSKSIQKIIKNLKAKGFEPESITETKHDTQVYYESSFIMLQKIHLNQLLVYHYQLATK